MKFIVVTGPMRSGTTLIGELLGSRAYAMPMHSDLCFDNDRGTFLRQLGNALRMQAGLPGGGFADPFQRLELSPATAAAFFGRPFASKEEAQQEVRSRILEEVRGNCENPAATAFGLKLTSLTHEIDLLAELFADVRVVFMVRDPRDTVASYVRRYGSARLEGKDLLIVNYILSQHYYMHALARSGASFRRLVLRYEDCVRDVPNCVRRLLAFLDLDEEHYRHDVIAEGKIASNSSYNMDRGLDFELGRGIDTVSLGRYREVLREQDVRLVEQLCMPIMREHNYEMARQLFSFSTVPRPAIREFAEAARTFGISTSPMRRALLTAMQLPAFFELRGAAAGSKGRGANAVAAGRK